jgi:hypothetical protein
MKNINKIFNRIKNQKTEGSHWTLASLFALAMMIPSGASAQSIVAANSADDPKDSEMSLYQESYQQQIVTPYQQESFEQNQLSYGVSSSHQPTLDDYYAAEERAYRNQEEEFELEREMIEAEFKQRQQNFILSQQAEDYDGNEGAFDGHVAPQLPVIVDNNNNSQVVIQLGEDNEKNLTQSGSDNELGLLQTGKNNKGSIDQQGSQNKAAIAQQGQNNSANIRQSGSNNSATIDLGN